MLLVHCYDIITFFLEVSMRRHFIVATSLACLMTAGVHGQQRLTLIGCLMSATAEAAPTPFVLTNAALRDAAPRARGSNSPKSSTPVGGRVAPARSGSSGSTTPKGSTPLRTVPVVEASSAGVSSTTAKASVPIPRRDSVSPTYELDAAPNQVSFLTGQTVEITGPVLSGPTGAAAPRLKVEQVRMLSENCTTR